MTKAICLEDCLKAVSDEFLDDDRAYIPTGERAHARLMVMHGVCAAQQTGRMTYLRMVGKGFIITRCVGGRSVPCYDMQKIIGDRLGKVELLKSCFPSSSEGERECVSVCVCDSAGTATVSRRDA